VQCVLARQITTALLAVVKRNNENGVMVESVGQNIIFKKEKKCKLTHSLP
jgi:predicted nicotinamide N-methyase